MNDLMHKQIFDLFGMSIVEMERELDMQNDKSWTRANGWNNRNDSVWFISQDFPNTPPIECTIISSGVNKYKIKIKNQSFFDKLHNSEIEKQIKNHLHEPNVNIFNSFQEAKEKQIILKMKHVMNEYNSSFLKFSDCDFNESDFYE